MRYGVRADAHERAASRYGPMRTSGAASLLGGLVRLNDQSAPCPVCSSLYGFGFDRVDCGDVVDVGSVAGLGSMESGIRTEPSKSR